MNAKILWLCSWYPNDEDVHTGDFIQRHALAVSGLQKLEVLHVFKSGTHATAYDCNQVNENLREHIYYNQVKGNGIIATLIGLFNYVLIHLRHIEKHGKPDIIHVQIPMKSGLIALYFKWRYRIPYIVTEHYGIYNFNLDDHYKSRNFMFRFFTKLIIKNADKLTTVSKSLGEEMNAWVTKKEYQVIPNVVDTSLFYYRSSPQPSQFQFIHISNMIPLKNVEGIIEAVEILYKQRNDFKISFIGSTNSSFVELAKMKNLLGACISFEGIVPYSEISQRISNSNALIIFSDTESQSCVVLEALCCGKPAIVSNIGGVKELIDDENGYKVEVRNSNDLAEKMNMMMNEYAQFNGKQIANKAISKYAYHKVGKQFLDLYTSILKKHKGIHLINQ